MRSRTEQGEDRRIATIVGVLFVVATVLYLVGGAVYGPSLGSSDYLESAYPDRATVRLGVLLEFVCVRPPTLRQSGPMQPHGASPALAPLSMVAAASTAERTSPSGG